MTGILGGGVDRIYTIIEDRVSAGWVGGTGVCVPLTSHDEKGVLRALCASQRWEEALQLLCRMDEMFVKPEATSA